MKVSYEESLANYFGLQRRGGLGNRSVLSVRAKGKRRPAIELPVFQLNRGTTSLCRSCCVRKKATSSVPLLARCERTRRSPRTCVCVEIPNACALLNNGREVPSASGAKPHGCSFLERPTNLSEGNVGMNAFGKSDDFVVLSTQVYNAATAVAESVEGRRSPKGSLAELSPMLRTQSRIKHQLEWHGKHDW